MVQQSRRVERLVPTSTQAATGGESALSPHDLQKQAALETGPPSTCFQPLQCSPFISLGTVLQRLTRFAAPPVKSQPPSFPERRSTHVSPPISRGRGETKVTLRERNRPRLNSDARLRRASLMLPNSCVATTLYLFSE